MLKATVLIDNVSESALKSEWGLAIDIEYNGLRILLDTGASAAFAANAVALGIDLAAVDMAVLSHSHFDHSDGMAAFFAQNDRAKFYLQAACAEDCYAKEGFWGKYIGIERGTLRRYAERIEYVDGEKMPMEGVYLLGHTTDGLSAVGRAAGMFRRRGLRRWDDDFAHEQSLVIKTKHGLAVFNSCCHAGADTVLREVQERFPDEPIGLLAGGFHLYQTPDDDVRAFARRVLDTGVQSVWTGHCTGERAMEILKQEMGDRLHRLCAGAVIAL